MHAKCFLQPGSMHAATHDSKDQRWDSVDDGDGHGLAPIQGASYAVKRNVIQPYFAPVLRSMGHATGIHCTKVRGMYALQTGAV